MDADRKGIQDLSVLQVRFNLYLPQIQKLLVNSGVYDTVKEKHAIATIQGLRSEGKRQGDSGHYRIIHRFCECYLPY
jgi:hypothetical protein